jgi:hypothetical protein
MPNSANRQRSGGEGLPKHRVERPGLPGRF